MRIVTDTNVLVSATFWAGASQKVIKMIELGKLDPDDDNFLEAAIEGDAKYIISQDNDLLNLKEFESIHKLSSS